MWGVRWGSKELCQRCRGCCIFKEDELYFAPLFTEEEVQRIKVGFCGDFFTPYKKSGRVFQVRLVRKSVGDVFYHVCPFLDESTHLCRIYDTLPFDCRFWPFIFMKNNGKTFLSCFSKSVCLKTEGMDELEFKQFRESFIGGIGRENALNLIRRYPDLLWDYEPDASIIEEVNV
jgi:Fe-S-cluster containining protein